MLEVSIYKRHEAFYLLGYRAVSSVERQPTFRRNMFPSLGSKNTPSKKPATADITWLYLLLASRCYLAWLLRPWRRRRHVPQKRRFTFSGLHILASLKLELFITTAVRTSNPTRYETFDNVSRASLETDLKKWVIERTSSTNWLTHSTVQPTDAQLVKKFSALCGNRGFITMFTRSRHWSLSAPSCLPSVRSNLVLSSHLNLRLPSALGLSNTFKYELR
jgi:hypothetical protein